MNVRQEPRAWSSWLARLRPQRAVCAFVADLESAREEIESFALSAEPQTVVAYLDWDELPRLDDELQSVARGLGHAVKSLWPALYGFPFQAEPPPPEKVITQSRRVPRVIAALARRIISSCANGHAPELSHYPLADQLQQLVLALAPERTLIVLLVRSGNVSRDRALAFARGAEWIAEKSGSRVIALLPSDLGHQTELDHISYGAFHDSLVSEWRPLLNTAPSETPVPTPVDNVPPDLLQQQSGASRRVDLPANPALRVTLGPILGRPHPGSDAEKLLHARITADDELRPLFHFNQTIKTASGASPCVDLYWPDKRLVLEIDGQDHQRQSKFASDRRRDFDLVLHGYTVVRFTSYDVEVDPELTLEKLRKLVRFMNQKTESLS